jgi:hypothetical protein
MKKQGEENMPYEKLNAYLRWIAGILVGITVLLAVITGLQIRISMQVTAVSGLIESTARDTKETIENSFEKQTTRLSEEHADMVLNMALKEKQLEETVTMNTNRIMRNIDNTSSQVSQTNSRVAQTEQHYANLLAEQQKKTLESLYDENALIDKMNEAKSLFTAARHKSAHDIFVVITEEQPGNQEAWFFRYYSLFLINRSDREQYRHIKAGFSLLERNGYSREEMGEVLRYIAIEENGVPADE